MSWMSRGQDLISRVIYTFPSFFLNSVHVTQSKAEEDNWSADLSTIRGSHPVPKPTHPRTKAEGNHVLKALKLCLHRGGARQTRNKQHSSTFLSGNSAYLALQRKGNYKYTWLPITWQSALQEYRTDAQNTNFVPAFIHREATKLRHVHAEYRWSLTYGGSTCDCLT